MNEEVRKEIERPRLRSFDGKEQALPSWEGATTEDWLGKWAMKQMLATKRLDAQVQTFRSLARGRDPAIGRSFSSWSFSKGILFSSARKWSRFRLPISPLSRVKVIRQLPEPVRGMTTRKCYFLSGWIEHGWNIHAKKLRRACEQTRARDVRGDPRRQRRFFREGDEMAASFDKLIQEIGTRYSIGPKACPLVQETLGSIIAGFLDRFKAAGFAAEVASRSGGTQAYREARIIAPQPCMRWIIADPNHDAVIRIGGEAPGRRAQGPGAAGPRPEAAA